MSIDCLKILPAVPAAVMCVSDFRNRKVSVLSAAAYLLCTLAFSVMADGVDATMVRAFRNMTLLAVFYILLQAYFCLKNGRLSGIIDNAFGKGDALFVACTGIMLEPCRLCLFIAVSCLAGIAWGRITARPDIPFVGLGVPVMLLFLLFR